MRVRTVSAFVTGALAGAGAKAGFARFRPAADTPADAPPAPASDRAPASVPDPDPGAAVTPAPPAEGPADQRDALAEALEQRRVLVDAFIVVADVVRGHNEALWECATDALAAVGVDAVVPDGLPLDLDDHHPVDRLPAPDPARHRTIASTDLAGFRDGTRWIRKPQVVVYRHEDAHETP